MSGRVRFLDELTLNVTTPDGQTQQMNVRFGQMAQASRITSVEGQPGFVDIHLVNGNVIPGVLHDIFETHGYVPMDEQVIVPTEEVEPVIEEGDEFDDGIPVSAFPQEDY